MLNTRASSDMSCYIVARLPCIRMFYLAIKKLQVLASITCFKFAGLYDHGPNILSRINSDKLWFVQFFSNLSCTLVEVFRFPDTTLHIKVYLSCLGIVAVAHRMPWRVDRTSHHGVRADLYWYRNAVCVRYIAVIFLWMSRKRQPIARLWGRNTRCRSWIQISFKVLPVWLLRCAQYRVICGREISRVYITWKVLYFVWIT